MNSEERTGDSTGALPSGIPYIIGNEAAERFSYYGMKTILVVFMCTYLRDRAGSLQVMSEEHAANWYHLFNVANYLCPLFGAVIADAFWGKYRTIMVFSVLYCFGHLALAIDETRFGLGIGLALIALGAGGIKPCVSAHVGDQFGSRSSSQLTATFAYFYVAINVGATTSGLLTPFLLDHYGPHVAFGVPGILMLIATIIFWLGRTTFIAIPPVGWGAYRAQFFSPEALRLIRRLGGVYLCVACFWALFDQTGSSWVIQAEKLNREISISLWGFTFHWTLLSSQLQALNPLLILLLVPLANHWIYPAISRRFAWSSQDRMVLGLCATSVAFLMVGLVEHWLAVGAVSVVWQALAYLFVTVGEILVSITALEYAYREAPLALKSFIMSFYLLAVSVGNAVTAVVNVVLELLFGPQMFHHAGYYFSYALLGILAAALLRRLSVPSDRAMVST